MSVCIRVAILDDHQSIIDGFKYRLSINPELEIVGTATYGEELEPMIAAKEVDVLLLDISVPNSMEDRNPYPVLHIIPRLLQKYPKMSILVISMYTQQTLIEALVSSGVSGYIFKDDQASIQKLDKIVKIIANGGVYFSQGAYKESKEDPETILTARQLEAISLCAAHPGDDTVSLAVQMGVTGSTLRNLLSGTYLRLGVRTRAAAIAKAHQMGIIAEHPEPSLIAKRRSVSHSKKDKKVHTDPV